MPTMADPLRALWWNMCTAPGPVEPVAPDRPCGCYGDPVVFGHFRPYGCEGKGVIG